MEDFARLFGSLLAFVYHCFDRVVIRGHLPLLTSPENIVHFFRDVHGIEPITKEVLRQRTTQFRALSPTRLRPAGQLLIPPPSRPNSHTLVQNRGRLS